jgi:hypothetical protein
MTNLKLHVTEEDYQVFAGPSWPSYQDYLNGDRGTNWRELFAYLDINA